MFLNFEEIYNGQIFNLKEIFYRGEWQRVLRIFRKKCIILSVYLKMFIIYAILWLKYTNKNKTL